MSRARLYLDENALDVDVVGGLRRTGIDVISAQDAGMLGRGDEDQLEFATSQGRVLYSFNIRHFQAIHTRGVSSGHTHAGVIVATLRQHSIGDQIRRLVHLVSMLSAEEMRDRLEFLCAW